MVKVLASPWQRYNCLTFWPMSATLQITEEVESLLNTCRKREDIAHQRELKPSHAKGGFHWCILWWLSHSQTIVHAPLHFILELQPRITLKKNYCHKHIMSCLVHVQAKLWQIFKVKFHGHKLISGNVTSREIMRERLYKTKTKSQTNWSIVKRGGCQLQEGRDRVSTWTISISLRALPHQLNTHWGWRDSTQDSGRDVTPSIINLWLLIFWLFIVKYVASLSQCLK